MVIIFSWQMFLRRLSMRRNLFKRRVFGRIEEPHYVRYVMVLVRRKTICLLLVLLWMLFETLLLL